MATPPNLLNSVKIVSGQTKVIKVTVKTCEGRNASLVDAVMYFTVKADSSSDALIQLSSPDNGIEITDAQNGQATITIPSDQSVLAKGCYYYGISVEYPSATPPVRYPVVNQANFVVEASLVDYS